MKLTSLAVMAVSAAAAVTTGVVSYEAFAPADAPAAAAATDRQQGPGRVVRLADCPRDTVLRGKFCIRTEERTVTEYVAAPAAPVRRAPVAPTSTTPERRPSGDPDDRDSDDNGDDDDEFDDHDDHDDDDGDGDHDDHDD